MILPAPVLAKDKTGNRFVPCATFSVHILVHVLSLSDINYRVEIVANFAEKGDVIKRNSDKIN